jgi:hypothetical protein
MLRNLSSVITSYRQTGNPQGIAHATFDSDSIEDNNSVYNRLLQVTNADVLLTNRYYYIMVHTPDNTANYSESAIILLYVVTDTTPGGTHRHLFINPISLHTEYIETRVETFSQLIAYGKVWYHPSNVFYTSGGRRRKTITHHVKYTRKHTRKIKKYDGGNPNTPILPLRRSKAKTHNQLHTIIQTPNNQPKSWKSMLNNVGNVVERHRDTLRRHQDKLRKQKNKKVKSTNYT